MADQPDNRNDVVANAATDARLCSKCQTNPRDKKHRWCRACQNDARRAPRHGAGRMRRTPRAKTDVSGNAKDAANGGAANPPSNEPEVFGRANGRIPRRDVTLVYRAVLHDEAETLYQQLVRGLRSSPRFALDLLERIADRMHGKPKQPIEATARRPVYFTQAMPADQAEAAAVAVLDAVLEPPEPERVDLAAALPAVLAEPLQAAVVMPPPR